MHASTPLGWATGAKVLPADHHCLTMLVVSFPNPAHSSGTAIPRSACAVRYFARSAGCINARFEGWAADGHFKSHWTCQRFWRWRWLLRPGLRVGAPSWEHRQFHGRSCISCPGRNASRRFMTPFQLELFLQRVARVVGAAGPHGRSEAVRICPSR